MKLPNRYTCKTVDTDYYGDKRNVLFPSDNVCNDSHFDADEGDYVRWEDYAALQAEVERLKAETVKQIEAALPPVEAYIAKLEAENERLRKAGDAMADKIRYDEKTLDEDWGVEGREHRTVQAWFAAKGVQP